MIWVLIMTLILPPSMGRPFRGLVFSYQSPILPITSLLMFFCFLRIKVQQRWINWIAKSVFGIYLMHENSFCSFLYHTNISNIYRDTNGIECFALIALNILAVFVGAIVIDKIMREPVQKYSQKLILTLYTCCKKKANRLVLLRDQ